MTIPRAETERLAKEGVIVLPFPPSTLSGHNTGNRYVKAALIKQWRNWAWWATRAVKLDLPPEGDLRVEVTFYAPDRRSDRANYGNRCKPIFDGIADALAVNDRRFVPSYAYGPLTKPGRVEIRITGCPGAAGA